MERGKQKCEELKRIRKAFADANGIEYTPSECSSTEECSGTCPKCEAEAEYIMSKVKEKNSSVDAASTGIHGTPETIDSEEVRIVEVMANSEDTNYGEDLCTAGIIVDDSLEDVIFLEDDLPDDVILEDVTPGNIDISYDDEIIDISNKQVQIDDSIIIIDSEDFVYPDDINYEIDDVEPQIKESFKKQDNEQ